MKIVIGIFLMVFSISCINNRKNESNYSIRDSILKEHLLSLDSIPYNDTTDINFKVLKAYQRNDTGFFKDLHEEIERKKIYQNEEKFRDSCIHQLDIQDLNVDEAFRFIYTAAFCPYTLNITVTKEGNSANIHLILYQYRIDTTDCRIINQYDKSIPMENWNMFKEALENADFWGLKPDNNIRGLDGSTLITIGFVRYDPFFPRPARFNYVYRWMKTTLKDPFYLILKLSGNRQGCISIR